GVVDDIVPKSAVQEELPWIVLVAARPLDAAELFEPGVAHARVHRREGAQLVPEILGARAAEIVSHSARELVDDRRILARLAGRVERRAGALHAPLARGHRPPGLAQRRGGGKDDAGARG